MGLPNIIVNFETKAIQTIEYGERGIVAIILKDATNNGLIEMLDITDIPATLSTDNKEYIKRAFVGNVNAPQKVIAYVLPVDAIDYIEALDVLETVKFDYLVCGHDADTGEITSVATWIKSQRADDKKVKAILPQTAGDHEGIINFDIEYVKVGATSYTALEYCSRIAGLLAGTPLYMSATFSPLAEVTEVPRVKKSALSTMIDAGKFTLFHDGEKVKVARAVNSLVTTTAEKSEIFKKIKIVDIADLIHSDIKRTAENDYIGKYPNDYDHKCLLITAIRGYLEGLETQDLLDKGKSSIGIDVEMQKEYLKSKGIILTDVNAIKAYNTDDKVFLKSTIKILDAVEDINLNIFL